MRVSRTALPLLPALGLSVAGPIAAPGIDPAEFAPTGAPNAPYLDPYLDAVRWRGLQTEVAYLRPDAPLPEEHWRDCLDQARPLFGAEKPA
jgi:hypothetical protein